MSTPHETFESTLKEAGYSVTTARRSVFNALYHAEPQTMAELIKKVSPASDRASVYRTIVLFEKLGIVQRLQIGWKYKLELSDAFAAHHHHLTCVNCGKIVPLQESTELEKHIEQAATLRGFKPLTHQLEISGLCPDCS
jgi:Fur family transcriptional regulator, ferric uptake regulator